MVIIANPIYDVVFKYLMANLGEELTKKDEELDKKDRYIQELEEKLKIR